MREISDTPVAGDEGEGSRSDFVRDLDHVACTAEAGFSLRGAEGRLVQIGLPEVMWEETYA